MLIAQLLESTVNHFPSLLALSALAATTGPAFGQESRIFLTKAEVEQTLVGRNHVFKTANGALIKWELRKDGQVYYTNMSARGVGGTGSGTYEVKDDGSICTKWNRVESGTGGCNYYFRDGDQIKRTRTNTADAQVNAQLERLE